VFQENQLVKFLCALMILTVGSIAGAGRVEAATPNIEWQRSFGGSDYERAQSIQQTTDGGYIVTGYTESNDGDVIGHHGDCDAWVIKLDSSGSLQWQKALGGSDDDYGQSIRQTSDGGYIMAGYANSNDGGVNGNHGRSDCWVVKLDPSGEIQWQKLYGGSDDDAGYSIQQTSDGGYIVAGDSESADGDVTDHRGPVDEADYWIIKLDSSGTIQWQKSLGGTNNDRTASIQQTTDGGYIVAGYSWSSDGDVRGSHGGEDYWVVKLDSSGEIQWQRALGGSGHDWAQSIQQTTDGGYVVAGWAGSNNGDVVGYHGSDDYWVVKLNSSGVIQWQKALGGTGYDWGRSIQQTVDGGYVVAGTSNSKDGDVGSSHADWHAWVVKLSSSGGIQWQKPLGGTWDEEAYSIQQTADGDYILAGYSDSYSDNHGREDYWIVKLTTGNIIKVTVTFNSNGGSSVPSQNIASGGKAVRPTAPTRAGYTFDGWYEDESLSNLWDFNTVVMGNMTLYAKWSPINSQTSYTVTFNSMGGSNVPSQTVVTGGKVVKPTNPTRGGYFFTGWYKDSDYNQIWNFNTGLVTSDITLYAEWVPEGGDSKSSGGGGCDSLTLGIGILALAGLTLFKTRTKR
jgi:uncharacterized repeat protein (TIGR02543 family)